MARSRGKGKKNVKTFVETEVTRKKWEDTSITGERSEKTNLYKVGEE